MESEGYVNIFIVVIIDKKLDEIKRNVRGVFWMNTKTLLKVTFTCIQEH